MKAFNREELKAIDLAISNLPEYEAGHISPLHEVIIQEPGTGHYSVWFQIMKDGWQFENIDFIEEWEEK